MQVSGEMKPLSAFELQSLLKCAAAFQSVCESRVKHLGPTAPGAVTGPQTATQARTQPGDTQQQRVMQHEPQQPGLPMGYLAEVGFAQHVMTLFAKFHGRAFFT